MARSIETDIEGILLKYPRPITSINFRLIFDFYLLQEKMTIFPRLLRIRIYLNTRLFIFHSQLLYLPQNKTFWWKGGKKNQVEFTFLISFVSKMFPFLCPSLPLPALGSRYIFKFEIPSRRASYMKKSLRNGIFFLLFHSVGGSLLRRYLLRTISVYLRTKSTCWEISKPSRFR